MKSFKTHNILLEADYKRFLKKNQNLDDDQVDKINTYFSKTNTHAADTIKWQSKDMKKMTYDEFDKIMKRWKSGRKLTFKPVSIKGKKGEDYWEVKVKAKGFQCIIPLQQETAVWLNSRAFACEGADYCIGWSADVTNWDDIVIGEQQVPVYITNGSEKWIVMIYEDNHEYDIWDKMNNFSKRKKTIIPGFDVKKNLLTSGLKSLYDNLREEFFGEDNKRGEKDWTLAIRRYKDLINDLEVNAHRYRNRKWNTRKELKGILKSTIEYHRVQIELLLDREEALEDDNEGYEDELDSITDAMNNHYEILEKLKGFKVEDMLENHKNYEWRKGRYGDEPVKIPSVPEYKMAIEMGVEVPEIEYYGSDWEEWLERIGYYDGIIHTENLDDAMRDFIFNGNMYGKTAKEMLADNGIFEPHNYE